MILLGGAILLIIETLLVARTRTRSVRWRFVLLLVPLVAGAVFGLLRLARLLEQLPEPTFTSPPECLFVPAGLVAVGCALLLRGMRVLALLLLDLGIATSCLALNYHASFGKDAIALRPLLAPFERTYGYDHVRAIRYVTHRIDAKGKLVPDPRFVIDFDDGTVWTSQDGLRREVPRFDADVIEVVGARSGKPRQQVLKLEGS
ncbi:MAG TPA: hypothetical protein VFF73_26180 [Planctomycetota bacterium]|nr:hypothetical protein [Planctomycetota bacterium]